MFKLLSFFKQFERFRQKTPQFSSAFCEIVKIIFLTKNFTGQICLYSEALLMHSLQKVWPHPKVMGSRNSLKQIGHSR